jgi:hypothetical protein
MASTSPTNFEVVTESTGGCRNKNGGVPSGCGKVQVLLANAYVLYKTAHLYMWKNNKKGIMSQYEFRHQIALAWLSGDESSSQGKHACTISDYDGISISTPSSNKARKVSDASLDPNHGNLCM